MRQPRNLSVSAFSYYECERVVRTTQMSVFVFFAIEQSYREIQEAHTSPVTPSPLSRSRSVDGITAMTRKSINFTRRMSIMMHVKTPVLPSTGVDSAQSAVPGKYLPFGILLCSQHDHLQMHLEPDHTASS